MVKIYVYLFLATAKQVKKQKMHRVSFTQTLKSEWIRIL